MTTPPSVFVVDLQYIVPMSDVEPHIPGHVEFLNEGFKSGLFLMSGAKVPRTGGMIIAQAANKDALEAQLAKDPFHVEKVAHFQITEFQAKMYKDGIFS